MTQEEYLEGMKVWADGERMVPEAYIGGLDNVYSHFVHWEHVASLIDEGDKVLEAGCGCGLPARIYSLKSRCPVVAADQDYAVRWAEVLYPTPGVRFVSADFNRDDWAVGLGPFDSIVCIDVLEHIQEKDVFLSVLGGLGHESTKYIISAPIGGEDELSPNHWHLHFWHTKDDLLSDVGRFLPLSNVRWV